MIIEGAISVKAALSFNNRDVLEVYIDKDKKTKDFNYIRKITKEHNIKLLELERSELDKLTSSKSYGGVLANVSIRKSNTLNDGDIFLIDGVEDPFNLGYIMRSCFALGVSNIILPKRDYSFMEAQILKSSAGAYDSMNIYYSDDLVRDVQKLKDKYHVYGLKRSDNSKDIFNESFKERCLFLIGGEKRGITASLEELCDSYLYIPYGSDFRNALNACSASAIVMTLLYRQRRQ